MNKNRHPILDKYLEYINAVRGYSDHTYRSYAYDLNEYILFCKNYDSGKDFTKLDRTAIQAYLQQLTKRGLSAKTLARRLASIKSLYKYMLINNFVNLNSMKFVFV